MKKLVVSIVVMGAVLGLFASPALAAPSADSYFSADMYNRMYTDDDGYTHTVKCTKVGETWNKVGTVIYNIYYEDSYTDSDKGQHTGAYSDIKSFKDARPTYPNCSHYSVYRINWYRDGSSKVSFDYRSEGGTASPTATPKPTAKPSSAPNPTATVKTTSKPVCTVVMTATVTSTITPTATLEITATPTPTPSASPMDTVEISTPSPVPTVAVTPEATIEALPVQQPSQWALYPTWMKVTLYSVGGVILAVVMSLLYGVLFDGNKKSKKKVSGNDEK